VSRWASVAGLLLLACHAQGRTRTGLESKFADRVAAVLADAVRACLELLEGMLGLREAGPGVGGQGDLVDPFGRLGPSISLVVARTVARCAKQVIELLLGELELLSVHLDLLEEDGAHLLDLCLTPRALVVLDPKAFGKAARPSCGGGPGSGRRLGAGALH